MDQVLPWDLPAVDLLDSITASAADLETWQSARILITGGTGFLGSWIVAALLRANQEMSLGCKIVLVTRNPASVPLVEEHGLTIVQSDVRSLASVGTFDLVIHGAASSSAPFGIGDGAPSEMAATIVEGSQSVIAAATKSHAKVLFLSSGAVYGTQYGAVSENVLTGPDPLDPKVTYGHAKRLAESLFVVATAAGDLDAVIARLFAFVGPRLPLDAHYAAGNFIRDVLEKRTIQIAGDGRPRRSYLYAGDLAEWCWAIVSRGVKGTAYNVGSPEPITISDLARRIANLGETPVEVQINGMAGSDQAPWYVPTITRAESELGLRPRTELDVALRKYHAWNKNR